MENRFLLGMRIPTIRFHGRWRQGPRLVRIHPDLEIESAAWILGPKLCKYFQLVISMRKLTNIYLPNRFPIKTIFPTKTRFFRSLVSPDTKFQQDAFGKQIPLISTVVLFFERVSSSKETPSQIQFAARRDSQSGPHWFWNNAYNTVSFWLQNLKYVAALIAGIQQHRCNPFHQLT